MPRLDCREKLFSSVITVFIRCLAFVQFTCVTDAQTDGNWCNNRPIKYAVQLATKKYCQFRVHLIQEANQTSRRCFCSTNITIVAEVT